MQVGKSCVSFFLFGLISYSHPVFPFQLPFEIESNIDKLFVNRSGTGTHSFMRTESIVGVVNPKNCYALNPLGLTPISCNSHFPTTTDKKTPPHVFVDGQWIDESTVTKQNANILGGFGSFICNSEALLIPVSPGTKEGLAFYDSKFLEQGDIIEFETPSPLGMYSMSIGEDYVDGYLMNSNLGHGAYLEFHDRPHFHMPKNPGTKGALILGKKTEGGFYLSAFSIPFGAAIYTAPNVIHADSHLIGEYLVAYSVTNQFSTTIVKNKQNRLVPLHLLPFPHPAT